MILYNIIFYDDECVCRCKMRIVHATHTCIYIQTFTMCSIERAVEVYFSPQPIVNSLCLGVMR